MKISLENELTESLLNVRKSYRLLFEYQSRIKDLVKYIGNKLSYSYSGGWPIFSNPAPKRGAGSLDSWAWDWLNMYCYAFHFGSKSINGTSVTFEMRIYSDTGYYDSEDENKTKCNLGSYSSVENSTTKLVFLVSKKGWDPEALLESFSTNKSEYQLLNNEYHMLAKSYELSHFLDEESVNTQIQDFILYCKKGELFLEEAESEHKT